MPRFRFRLEPVLEHRVGREESARRDLAMAVAAAAAQRERAVEAARAADRELAALRGAMSGAVAPHALRAGHEDLGRARARAAHEAEVAAGLEAVADERRAELVEASRDREALSRLRRADAERHRRESLRREDVALDELAMRRALRRRTGGRRAAGVAAP